jgi:hypothetical protein
METTTRPNGTAPLDAGTYKLGAKGGRMASAWQHVWDRLDRTEYRGALELAQAAAQAYDLKSVSVSEMLCRMRAAGVIEQKMIKAPTTYNRPQTRTEYAVGDWDMPITLTDKQCKSDFDDVLRVVMERAHKELHDAEYVDHKYFVREASEDLGLNLRMIGEALRVMTEAGVLSCERVTRDSEFTANRPRVHYRIAETSDAAR